MSFPFLFSHLFWFDLTCHVPHKLTSCLGGTGDLMDRWFACTHLYLCNDSEE